MNSAFVQVLTAIAMVLTIVVPMTYYFKGEHNKNRYKKSLAANVSGFFGLLLIATVVSFAGATTASAATEAGAGLATGLGYIGAALVTGLSCIGGGIAVAGAAPAAIGATSEDPKAFGKSLIFVALGEGVALYGLLVSILILNKF